MAALGACTPTSGTTSASAAAAPGSNFGRENRVVDADAVNGSTVFVEMKPPTILVEGSGPFHMAISSNEVVLSTDAEGQSFREITYIIKHEDDPSYRLQIFSAADLDNYRVSVSFKRLYRGKYTVEAYGGDDLEPVGAGRFEVTDEGL